MAQTTYSQLSTSGQVPQVWARDMLAQAENLTFWKRWEGVPGSDMPVIRRDDLTKTAGDTIKMDLVLALTGAGVTADTTALHGNAENLKMTQQSLVVNYLSHAVEWTEQAQVTNVHDLRTTAAMQLAKWLAGKLDDEKWTTVTAASQPTPNKWFAGAATSAGTVTSAYYITLNDISDIRAYAQATLKLAPLQVEGGEEFYGLVMHPFAELQLKKDSTYLQAQRDANVRGSQNPLFTGASFVWDGVIGFRNSRVPTANDGAGSVTVARNVLFGAQALTYGWAMYPDWREEEFDYARAAGVATTMLKGAKLNVFDLSSAQDTSGNQAIGSALLYSYAAAPVA